jgi:hypothetical protein
MFHVKHVVFFFPISFHCQTFKMKNTCHACTNYDQEWAGTQPKKTEVTSAIAAAWLYFGHPLSKEIAAFRIITTTMD